MPFTKKLLLSLLTTLPLLTLPGIASAHTLSDDPGSYTPNSLISDDSFTGYGYDGAGVASFLSEKGSWLKGYNIPEYQEVPYKYRDSNGNCQWAYVSVRQFNDVTGERLYNYSAADLIAKEGHDHGVNPQVLLVTLEKESSAISRSSVQSAPVEMWVLGYGWNDTMAGCGYNYDTARARAINYGGVGQQIAYSMSGLRSLYDRSGWETPFNTVDGTNITATNRATRALYLYTPYVHNGNHNFWRFYTLWFQTRPTFSPTAYGWYAGRPHLVYNGQIWPFNDVGTFEHFLPGKAGEMSQLGSEHLNLPVRHSLGRLIRKSGDGTIYYMLNGTRKHIKSERILNLYGWRMEDVVGDVDDKLIDAIPVNDPMLGILRVENSISPTYLQTRGENHKITDQAIFQDNWNFKWDEVAEVPPYVVNRITTTNNLGTIALSNEGTAYFMDKGKRYHIPDNNTAERWGLDWSTAVRFDTPLLWRFPEDNRLTPYARNEKTGHVYVLEKGKRRWLSEKRIKELRIDSRDIVNHSDAVMNRIPEGSNY